MIYARLLGGFEVEVAGQRIARFRSRQAAALFAYLIRHPGQHSRMKLAQIFWGRLPEEAALNNLRVTLSSLRALLEPPSTPRGSVLMARRRTVGLAPGVVQTDVDDFESLCHQALQASDVLQQRACIERARALYRGDFLEGFDAPWIEAERRRLRLLYEQLPAPPPKPISSPERPTTTAATSIKGIGVIVGIVPHPLPDQWNGWIRAAVATHRGILLASNASMDLVYFSDLEKLPELVSAVLTRAPQSCLAIDLGMVAYHRGQYEGKPFELMPLLLQAAHPGQVLCTQRFVLLLSQLCTAPPLHPLGCYWLSPEFACEQLYQLGGEASQFPPLQAPLPVRKSLPGYHDAFIGRDVEVAQLCQMLGAEGAPIVTLLGPPGGGKTRLAVECAWRLDKPFGEARWYVPLLNPAHTVYERWAQQTGWPAESLEQCLAHAQNLLVNHAFLLVVDTPFPLTEAQRAEIDTLLQTFPKARLLLIAPKESGISGEHTYRIAPLAVPPAAVDSPDQLWHYASVRLLVARAQQQNPDFRLTERTAREVSQLCRLSGGLPLALELLASRIAHAPLNARAESDATLTNREYSETLLSERPLWESLEYSFNALEPSVQRILARLSLFHGTFTPIAAQAIVQAPESVINRLVAKGLLQREGTRYFLLDPVRLYASRHLSPEERTTLKRAYIEYFADLIDSLTEKGDEWGLIEQERDHFDTALEWSVECDPSLGVRLATALASFWEARGCTQAAFLSLFRLMEHLSSPEEHLQIARITLGLSTRRGMHQHAQQILERYLPVAETIPDTLYAARLWIAAGFYYWHTGAAQQSQQLLQRALQVCRTVHSPIDRAEALTHLSIIHLVQERPQEAIPLLEEALELITLESAPRLYLSVWGNLANAFYQQGSRARAEICLRQASVLAEQLGDRRNQATLLNNWGVWMSESGELEKAHQLYTQSLAIWREVSEPIGEAVCLNNLGDLMMQQGDYESARAFLLQSIEGTQRYRIWWYLHNPLVNMAEIARRQGKWETARWWAQQSLSAALRYAAPKQADKALTILVHSTLELNDPRGAARAYALAERFECPITDPELLTRLFTQSSPEEVQRWCETMRQTSLEQILSELGPPAWIFDQTR